MYNSPVNQRVYHNFSLKYFRGWRCGSRSDVANRARERKSVLEKNFSSPPVSEHHELFNSAVVLSVCCPVVRLFVLGLLLRRVAQGSESASSPAATLGLPAAQANASILHKGHDPTSNHYHHHPRVTITVTRGKSKEKREEKEKKSWPPPFSLSKYLWSHQPPVDVFSLNSLFYIYIFICTYVFFCSSSLFYVSGPMM